MRKILLLSAKIFVSGALLFFALRKISFGDLVSRLDTGSIGWIVLAILIALLQIAFSALRWREITGECGAPLTTAQVLRFNLIGSFFNQTLPSSIGGDAVRILLVRRTGIRWRAAGYSVFIDRAIGLIALAIIVVATLPWSYQLIGDINGRYALLLIDFAALAGGMGFLIIGRLPWPWLSTRWQTKDIFACSAIANRLIFSGQSGPRIAILSLLIHLLTVTIAWCVVRSIAAPVTFFQVFELVPPVVLITMIPISIAGWGVREATMGLAFGYAGLMISEGVNVSLLFGAVYFLVGILGGLVWILSSENDEVATVLAASEQSR
jgi:glycosyltransferase 2 family protein